MGCASSSPLINGGGPGGIVETAKETASKTATEVLHAGETAIHDVGEHMKDAVKNVASEIEGVLGGKAASKDKSDHVNESDLPQLNGHDKDDSDYQIIPLKDPNKPSVDESLENMKNNLLKKAQSFNDDTEKMADDIMKETEDLIRDAETGIVDQGKDMLTRITSSEDGTIEILNLEEPEIERILDNDPQCPPTPEATMNSLVSSSDGAATESEAVDSAATVIEQVKPDSGHDESKREAIGRCSSNSSENFESIENADNNDGSFETDNSLPQDQQQPETITNAFEREASVLSPDGTEALQDALLDELEDDIREFEAEQQRQNRIHHFSFKLNSATLSIIEEKTDDDSSVNQQTPEKTVIEMNENERLVSVEAGDETHQEAELDIPVDSEGNEGLGNSQDDEVPDESSVPVDNEDNSSERSLKGFEDVEMLLNRMPLVTKLRMLTRFRSFDYPRGGADDDEESDEELEEQTRHPPKKFNLKDFKDKMQSESKLNISEGDDEHDEEGADGNESEVGDDDAIVPDELEENFDLEAAIDEVLAEQSPEVQKAKWKMLKRILRKIPYRANSFDLFSESDEDILENLFDQKRKEMHARSTDSVDES